MKATVKSVRLTQNGDINVLLNDAKIIGRRKSGDNYVIAEDDNFTVSIAQWRKSLHSCVTGVDFNTMTVQDAINVVLDCTDANRRIAAATVLLKDAIIDVEPTEFAAGEEIAEGYVAKHDGVKYDITSIVLSGTACNILKLQWAQTMGLSPEFMAFV